MVDEDAREAVADGALDQCCRDGGVDAAGQAADRLAVTDLLTDPGDLLVHDGRRRPLRTDARDLVQEPAQHLLAVRRVVHLRVVLHTGEPALPVLERGDRRALTGRGDGEALGRLRDGVAVAHPHRVARGEFLVQRAALGGHAQVRAAVLAGARLFNRAAKCARHGLEAVADAEDRDAGLEQLRVDLRGVLRVDARRATGQNDGQRVLVEDLAHGRGVRDDLGVDLGLADAAGDQLRVLGAEVDDENRAVAGVGHVAKDLMRGR